MLATSLLLLLSASRLAHAGVLINEVQYDPTGTDDGLEWVELCNDGADTVDLTGYTVQGAGSSWSTSFTLGAGTIAPGEYVIVGYGGSTFAGTFSPALQNGGSETDGVRLLDSASTVVDTVLYDSPNTNGLVDDSGAAGTSFAADATEGSSLGRWPDCTDSNASGTDFTVYATPSAGVVNVDPSPPDTDTAVDTSSDTAIDTGTPPGTDCTGSEVVTINEFTPATGEEWIELYNSGATALNVGGWDLGFGTSTYNKTATLPADTLLPAMGWLVVGSSGAVVKDVAIDMDLGNATSNADAIQLQCLGAAVDTVVYTKGSTNPDGWVDDSGAVATSFAPVPGAGQTAARTADGLDTNESGDDFVLTDTPTPDDANTTGGDTGGGGTADCTNDGDVKINEFTPQTDAEWVELYNAGAAAIDVSGWELGYGTSSYNKTASLPSGTMIPAGGWLVVGSATGDVVIDMDFGNATSSADSMQLQCNGDAVDTVIYGKATTNDDGWADDLGDTTTTSFAPVPGDGESSARIADGYDTDHSGDDFAISSPSTPDAANPVVAPIVCDPTGYDALKINEFLYDPDSTDAGHEWVELYNGGSAAVVLDGATIQTATSSWGVDFTFPGGTTLEPGAFELIGGDSVPGTNFIAASLSLGNGTGGDGVRLVDCSGVTTDTVLYGDTMTDGLTDDTGSNAVVAGTASGSSVGRASDGVDTNTPDDFKGFLAPTPGATNGEQDVVTDDTGVSHGGCPGSEPKSTRPGGGCAVAAPLGGGEVLLAALVLLRRKR